MIDYKKYKWFFTSSGKLVVGGKNSKQNEELIGKMLKQGKDYVVMHTASPGSPFSFIVCESNKINEEDLEETAIFTACFSHEWKKRKKEAKVDIFKSSDIYKMGCMKEGTFGVRKIVASRRVKLKLYLINQEGKLRAVPFEKKSLLDIMPGKIDKEKACGIIAKKLKVNKKEIMQALPAGGFEL